MFGSDGDIKYHNINIADSFRRARAGGREDLRDRQRCDAEQAVHLPLQVQRGALQ